MIWGYPYFRKHPNPKITSTYAAATFKPPKPRCFEIWKNPTLHAAEIHWETNDPFVGKRLDEITAFERAIAN